MNVNKKITVRKNYLVSNGVKKLLAILFLTLIPLISFAENYELQSGGVAVTLIIKPDELVARENARGLIIFKDINQLFSFKRCDCKIKIVNEKGKEIFNYILEQDSNYVEDRVKEFTLLFPEIGKYKFIITGESKNQVFSSFNMETEISVNTHRQTEAEKNWEALKKWLISLGVPLAVVLGTAGIIFQFILKKK